MRRMTTFVATIALLLACAQSANAHKLRGHRALWQAIGALTERMATLEQDMDHESGRTAALEGQMSAIWSYAALMLEGLQTLETELSQEQGRTTELESQVSALRGYAALLLQGLETIEQMRGTVADAEELLTYVSVDDTNVIIDGANLHIRSGAGRTDAEPNGLGNLLIGYNESWAICEGGPDNGETCIDASDCEDGICVRLDDPALLTGSHNLIIGTRNQHSSHSCLLVGDAQEATEPYCARLP